MEHQIMFNLCDEILKLLEHIKIFCEEQTRKDYRDENMVEYHLFVMETLHNELSVLNGHSKQWIINYHDPNFSFDGCKRNPIWQQVWSSWILILNLAEIVLSPEKLSNWVSLAEKIDFDGKGFNAIRTDNGSVLSSDLKHIFCTKIVARFMRAPTVFLYEKALRFCCTNDDKQSIESQLKGWLLERGQQASRMELSSSVFSSYMRPSKTWELLAKIVIDKNDVKFAKHMLHITLRSYREKGSHLDVGTHSYGVESLCYYLICCGNKEYLPLVFKVAKHILQILGKKICKEVRNRCEILGFLNDVPENIDDDEVAAQWVQCVLDDQYIYGSSDEYDSESEFDSSEVDRLQHGIDHWIKDLKYRFESFIRVDVLK